MRILNEMQARWLEYNGVRVVLIPHAVIDENFHESNPINVTHPDMKIPEKFINDYNEKK